VERISAAQNGAEKMIDPLNDQLISIEQVASRFPRKKSKLGRETMHVATVKRWVERGLKGVVLEAIPIGATYYTTAAAVQEFIQGLARAKGLRVPERPVTRTRRNKATVNRLAALGFNADRIAPDGDRELVTAGAGTEGQEVNGSHSHSQDR
jgi:hypothetical protein